MRRTYDDALGVAQAARTEMRLKWIDSWIDMFIAVFPEHKDAFELMRIDMHATNAEYVEALNNVDRTLINRLQAILLNSQIDREEQKP